MKPSDLQPLIDAIGRLASTPHERMWEHISTIAVVLTLGVLVWYTIETYLLRKAAQKQIDETDRLLKEAQRQNETAQKQTAINADLLKEAQRQTEISIQPMFAIYKGSPETKTAGYLVVENVGSGPAFNVGIVHPQWDHSRLEIGHKSNVMKPGDWQPLVFQLWRDEVTGDHIANVEQLQRKMISNDIINPLRIIIKCHDLGLTPYEYFFDLTLIDNHLLKIDMVLNRNSRHGFSV